MPTPAFQPLEVPAPLRGVVTEAWVLDMPAAHPSEQVLPMPGTEIIVNLSDPYLLPAGPDGAPAPTPPVFCTGLRPRVIRFENPAHLRHVAVRLPCGGLSRLGLPPMLGVGAVQGELGAALSALTNTGAPAADVADGVLAALVDHVREETDAQRCVRHAAAALQADPGRPVTPLARAAGITHKTLIARFRRVTGVTPSRFAQLSMVDAVVRAIPTSGPLPTWTDLVSSSPYVDQSHFIRSFRRLVGLSPREYRDALARSRYTDPRFVAADDATSTEG